MENLRNRRQKGITLIALVVTIVVLIILATVSILAVFGDNGIIARAQKAKDTHEEGKADEANTLDDYASYIANHLDGKGGNAGGEDTPTKELVIGSYVQYNMPYIDMFSGKEYTENNGWRYLGKDNSGNQLIVSTGIPVILDYHYNNKIGNQTDGGANSWWATKSEINSTTDTLYKTDKGYDYDTNSGEPNKYAAYGMRYKFDNILFTYQESGTSVNTANTGIFRKVGNTSSGTSIKLNFKASEVDVVDVHTLTLAELNKVTNEVTGSTREDTSRSSGFKDLTGSALGLFDMQKLEGYAQSYWYWLASPFESSRGDVCTVNARGNVVTNQGTIECGVRPVICIKPNVKLTVTK